MPSYYSIQIKMVLFSHSQDQIYVSRITRFIQEAQRGGGNEAMNNHSLIDIDRARFHR